MGSLLDDFVGTEVKGTILEEHLRYIYIVACHFDRHMKQLSHDKNIRREHKGIHPKTHELRECLVQNETFQWNRKLLHTLSRSIAQRSLQ